MSHKINLILGSHKHIPCGAGDDEFERAYEFQLKPFISTLYKYPKIQAVLHYSGVLLHWIERFHPEFLMFIETMVSRKQVEILGGGFYEPMMPLIPLQDKIGQIELLTTYLRKQFGKRPQGCWLPALAWEQNMVSPLNACGMGYTFLDEDQFKLAGLSGKALFTPCVSEDQGKLITVFPLSNTVKAEFTQKKASLVLNGLAEKLPGGEGCVVSVFPEGFPTEKDGSSGPEYACHEFFEELSRCEPFVEFTGPGKFHRGLQGLHKAYFPDSLGDCFGAEKGPNRFLPRRFLIDFPEANGIYSKMIFTRVLINQLRGDKSRKRTAREELWKAQGCDVFYHPKEYGIDRHSVRNAAYKSLLDAERICREKGSFIPSLMNFDFDMDGAGEYLFQDVKINCYIRLRGASVFELDYLPKTWNYLDTFSPETANAVRERRTAFADNFFPSSISLRDVLDGRSPGARYCGQEQFELAELDKVRGKVRFRLPGREGLPFGKVELEKIYFLKKDTLSVSYALINQGKEDARFQFAPAIDLSFPGEGEAFVRFFKLKSGVKDASFSEAIIQDAEGIKIQDLKNEVQIVLGSKKPFNACIVPVKTAGPLKGPGADLYQSTCIMPLQEALIPPQETWTTEFTVKFSH
ncbi:MAG: DUF1926 domain-containing protein [Treponema sp.]|jgi:hypothetical protein|nr:DUF1926 domain-containing protein [Treponema sp.]